MPGEVADGVERDLRDRRRRPARRCRRRCGRVAAGRPGAGRAGAARPGRREARPKRSSPSCTKDARPEPEGDRQPRRRQADGLAGVLGRRVERRRPACRPAAPRSSAPRRVDHDAQQVAQLAPWSRREVEGREHQPVLGRGRGCPPGARRRTARPRRPWPPGSTRSCRAHSRRRRAASPIAPPPATCSRRRRVTPDSGRRLGQLMSLAGDFRRDRRERLGERVDLPGRQLEPVGRGQLAVVARSRAAWGACRRRARLHRRRTRSAMVLASAPLPVSTSAGAAA